MECAMSRNKNVTNPLVIKNLRVQLSFNIVVLMRVLAASILTAVYTTEQSYGNRPLNLL